MCVCVDLCVCVCVDLCVCICVCVCVCVCVDLCVWGGGVYVCCAVVPYYAVL